ncbi:PEGA domain-containing protein [Myxococcota bacterium]|nr:PEGA domain-containing protein [Myxococcota bacterium]
MPYLLPLAPLAGLLFSSPAAAGSDTPEIAVVGLHVEGQDEQAAREAAARVEEALAQTGRMDPVGPDAVRKRLAGREAVIVEAAFLGPGRRALDEGRILYERAEFDDAVSALKGAVSLLEEALPVTTDNRLLIDALLMQGLTHFSVGDEEPARAAFERVALLDPTRRLDPVNYSGPTVEFFDQARAAVEARGVGALAVEGEEGAQVYVDGRARGPVPLRVDGLPAGPHAVLVVGAEGRRGFEQVEITQARVETVQPALELGLRVQAGTTDEAAARQTEQLYEALGAYTDAELVLVAGQSGPGEVAVQLYEPRTGNFSKIFRATGDDPVGDLADGVVGLAGFLDDGGALRTDKVFSRAAPLDIGTNTLLLGMLLDPAPASAAAGPVVATEDDGGRGVPWYLWAGVGAVAAGGVATTAVLLTSGEAEPSDHGTITVGPMP